jgi:hypothetical protein
MVVLSTKKVLSGKRFQMTEEESARCNLLKLFTSAGFLFK